MSELTTLLRTYRYRAGLFQREVAARLGVSRNAVAAWEHGTYPPSREHLFALMDVLGLSAVECDRLLLSAGYAPTGASVVYHQRDEPQLYALGVLLAGDDLTASERQEIRAALQQVLAWQRRGLRAVAA